MNSKLSGSQLIQLRNIIVENFNESDWRELGVLTNTLDQVEGHPRLLKSLRWNDSDYNGLALTFLKRMIENSDKNLDIVQDYISKNCKNSGENVSSEETYARKIVFSPTIFDIPNANIDLYLVSVMIPFDKRFDPVYETIKEASEKAGFKCKRADDIWDNSTIIQDIFSLIFQSYIVVCDFTGKNPNVFYEAGIAHTLGKHVVPITQTTGDIPFDLQHHRFAIYLNNGEGQRNKAVQFS